MKISKTARRSGATGISKSRGPERSEQKYKKGHRAHKRDSIPAKPVVVIGPGGKEYTGRDARKRLCRVERMHQLAVVEYQSREKTERAELAVLEALTAPEVTA